MGYDNMTDHMNNKKISTDELLVKILSLLQEKEGSYNEIDFEDIRDLLNEDMRLRINIYEHAHIMKIIETFNNRIDNIIEAKNNKEEEKVISLYREILDGYKYIPSLEHTISYTNKSAFNQEAFRHWKDDTIIVLGDSHVNFFSGNEQLRFYPLGNDINYCPMVNNLPFTILHLGPCLAYNSMKNDTSYKFKEKLEYLKQEFIKPGATLILSLGEIDMRAHVFKQTRIQAVPYENIVRDVFNQYSKLIKNLKEEGYTVIVYGPIASQPDECEIDSKFPRVGTEIERNNATLLFENILKDFCQINDIKFFTMYDSMITYDGHTNIDYLCFDKCHLGQKYIGEAIDKLKSMDVLPENYKYVVYKEKLVDVTPNRDTNQKNQLDLQDYDALIMVTPADYKRVEALYPKLAEAMPVRRICFVGSNEVGKNVRESSQGTKWGYINEDDIISFNEVNEAIRASLHSILQGNEVPRGITGWYYQQFLKMAYAKICPDEYYLVWDGDTVPCAMFSMFDRESNKPYFDLKTEFHEEYFKTISKILPGMGKVIKKSFISEHMIIKKQYMLELIDEIEGNDSIKGSKFYEKIINAIDPIKIMSNSFSEFETYGTFVALRHTNEYKLRNWYSFRYGGDFFDINKISESDFKWLSRDFYAISFEKGHSVREDHKNLFDNKEYQEKLSARQMLEIAQEEFSEDSFKESWE